MINYELISSYLVSKARGVYNFEDKFDEYFQDVRDGRCSISFVEVVGQRILASLTHICGGMGLFSVYNKESVLLHRYSEIFDKMKLSYSLPVADDCKYKLNINSITGELVENTASEFYIIPKFAYAVTYENGGIKSGISFTDDVVSYLIKNGKIIKIDVLDSTGQRFASIDRRETGNSLNIYDTGLKLYKSAEFRKWLRWYEEM